MSGANSKGMRLISFKPLTKGALRGFATVELPIGLTIAECPVCVSNGKAWAALPSKPVLGRDNRQVEADGKRQYVAILAWKDREISDRWSAAVVDLVRNADPHAFEVGGDR